jgi:hypothetical protein
VLNLQAGSLPMTLIFFLFALFVLPMFTPVLGNDSRSSSGDFPYSPQYIEVRGAGMHYVESGSGDPGFSITLSILRIFAHPGALTPERIVAWAKANLPKLQSVDIGDGIHNLQEDHPAEIGQAIVSGMERFQQPQTTGLR